MSDSNSRLKELTLSLFMLRIGANHPHHALAVYHLALITHLFY